MRRLVARTNAQQVVLAVEEATVPVRFVGGGECVAHAIQSDSPFRGRIGAVDLIARAAMLDGLLNVDGGDSVLPFVLQFCSKPGLSRQPENSKRAHFRGPERTSKREREERKKIVAGEGKKEQNCWRSGGGGSGGGAGVPGEHTNLGPTQQTHTQQTHTRRLGQLVIRIGPSRIGLSRNWPKWN